jgi:cell wall-associated NlpC family hydrolase
VYSPRHARPSCIPARAAVGTTLTAVLLPIALAAPALADEPATTTSSSDSGTTTTSSEAAAEETQQSTTLRISASTVNSEGRSRIGVRVLSEGRAVRDAEVLVEGLSGDGSWKAMSRIVSDSEGLAVGMVPFSRDTRIRATTAATMTRAEGVSPQIDVSYRQPTTMRVSAGSTGNDGRAPIGVRVLNGSTPVRDAYVAVNALSGDGTWKYIGRLLTNSEGLATGRLPFSRDTRVRSTYSGSATRLPQTSPEAVVTFVKPSTLGQQAVRIASEQQGKPYQYGSTGPSSFDCSGYVTYIYKTRLGKDVPRTSAQQEAYFPRVSQSAKQPGDLLFFRTDGRVSHVGVYAGEGKMWASPSTGDRVKLQSIYTSNYSVGRIS